MTIESGKIEIAGVQHYYEWIRQPSTHKKPTMVLVHGWGGSGRYWHSTAQALKDHFDCLIYDLRGFGRSPLPETGVETTYDLETYADDLDLLLEKLNLDQVYLNAHSMGASIAVFFLNRYPHRVVKSILTCNGIFDYNKWAFAAFYQFGGYVVKFRYPWFLKVPFADRMFMARFLHRSIPKRDRQAFLEDFLQADYDAALGTIYTAVSKQAVEVMPQEFARISVPTLMVSGEKDIIIPAAMGKKAAALNDKIEYVEIEKTAHFPMLEDAETYMNLIREFLEIEAVAV